MEKKKLRRKTQDVLTNRNLISKESANSPSIARRYAKGIVLSQKIGFNQGTFASLKDIRTSIENSMKVKLQAIASLLEEPLIF